MKQKGFLLDLNLCIGCQACALACRNENQAYTNNNWRKVVSVNLDYSLSFSCNHCESPECFRVCPHRAFNKRKDGIVVIDSERCDGCGICVEACPYKAPKYDEEWRKVSKCNFCLPRQLEGKIPACIEACSAGALQMIELDHYDSKDTVLTTEGFPDIHLTRPSIRFRLFKPRKRFWNNNIKK